MKKITLFLAILAGNFVSAQTLTYAAFSASLATSLNIRLANQDSFTVSPNTGPGAVWDASGLTAQSGIPEIHLSYFTPGSTPHGNLFPQSNYAQYDPALTAFLEYNYVEINSTGIYKSGTYAPSGEHEIFQNSDKMMTFPFSLNESFTDDYAKTNYSDATTISSLQTGTRTVSFVGSGSLILPQGTFTNVGFIEDVRTNSLGPNSYKYVWWDLSNGKELLVYTFNPPDMNTAYTTDMPLSTQDFTTSNDRVSLTPNPAHDTFTIHTQSQETASNVKIYNALGQLIYTNKEGDSINRGIDISGFARGICFVKVNVSGKSYMSKLLIQ